MLSDEIKRGEVIADNRYEVDSPNRPTAYLQFNERFAKLQRAKVFNEVGTMALDSTTTFSQSLLWQILKKEDRQLPGMTEKSDFAKVAMRPPDWGTFLSVFIMWTRGICTLPCHTVILGHLGREVDSVTQRQIKTILVAGQSKDQMAILTPEFYVLETSRTGGGEVTRKLLTQHFGDYRATTRIGRKEQGNFAAEEVADIRALLKKAKLNYEDKPH